jgi:hypothetical protein
MLRITIELVPYGKEEYKRTIGSIEIGNDGTGDYRVGNYKYSISDETGKIKGKLEGHNRLKSVFHLLRDILNKSIV